MCDIRHRQLRKYTGRKVAECMSRSMEDTVYDHMFTTRMILSAVDSMQRVMKVGVGQVLARTVHHSHKGIGTEKIRESR